MVALIVRRVKDEREGNIGGTVLSSGREERDRDDGGVKAGRGEESSCNGAEEYLSIGWGIGMW